MKLKWLKFYILGLIGLPIFLTNFSSSHYVGGYTFKIGDGSVGSFYRSPFNSGYTFGAFRDGGFSSSFLGTYKNVIYPGGVNLDSRYPDKFYKGFIFWDLNGRPYMYVSSDGNPNTSYHYNQGEITTYYVCDELYSGDTSVNNCDQFNVGVSFDSILYNFLSGLTFDDYYFIGYEGYSYNDIDRNTFKFCFSSHSAGSSLCFMASTCNSITTPCPSNLSGNVLMPILDFSPGEDFTTLPNNWLYFSPYPSSNGTIISSGNTVSTSPLYTIDTVYNAYAENGFFKSMCYSDYPLSDLISSSTTVNELYEPYLTDGVYYTGATIFDLYNAYGGSDPFSAFMGTYQAGYKIVSLRNDIPSFYYGKSKGLFYIFYKINLYHDNISEVYSDLYNYCTFALQKDSLTGTNSFNISYINSGSLPSSVSNYLLDNQENITRIPICTPGSALCNSMSGSGGTVIVSSDDGVGSFLENFRTIFGIVDSQAELGFDGSGILPYYIGLAFVSFLLLYLLKR